ncbi:hypothetical protein BOTNAR_0247g00130 [Botryotinia narcissicola]|uniref:Uncharacterized protein n=1 Tax=Botryotinia narcissicola TaxID=278944 RepID=A0A4Z1I1H1_9HELO|nr:hypothetical protein BOTNAR_0247g00130 [Botryotinia narcissicola]
MLGEQPVSGERADALITSDIADNTYTILKQFSEKQSPVNKINQSHRPGRNFISFVAHLLQAIGA